ncbi:putative Ulp1 protease family catalytic domain, putative transposase, Ptta/En/Spm, plant [Rosa chinensis]|uniref:Putative Ulp1 protease family catalytic domain, putative transposase, Ptta/En/Spm, plant n=1 Tax=Rosa chinensis TaxID=74649 RepID=A0A2P6SJN3_ROSCH|nr:putative Ulp1 protease family catalytic domain, putative transposase, Ptta/En/Spm, plant [Rosa chinensis]
MSPSSRSSASARSIALRIKNAAMKRSRSTSATPINESVSEVATSPKKFVTPPKKAATPKKPKATRKASSPKKRQTTSRKVKLSKTSKFKKVVASSKSSEKSILTKSKATAHDDDENKTGGLKLLKRGMVTMSRITNRLIRGKKLTVKFNDKGEPVGKVAKEMQSYIGVLARTKIPISISDWRDVDQDEKEKIWESITDAFVIPKECWKMVITSAANKWREFKSKLTKLYIIPYMNEPDLLEFPPDDYRSITKDNWQTFVADRLSAGFLEVREAQIMKRKENKYPHRMARKGYANLQEELSESVPLEQLDRATMWIKARQDRNGQFKQAEVEETAKKIENLKKREVEGEITTCGSDDVLTIALGNPEHHGRVRGVGGTVKPSAYFNLPKRQRKSVEETVRLSLKKIFEEEKDSLIAKERASWEEERDKQLAEERAYWAKQFARLEAKIDGKELPIDTPKAATPVNELGSGQGSCSRHGEKGVNCNGETEIVMVAKKKLVLRDDVNVVSKEELVHATNGKAKLTGVLEEELRHVFAVPKARVNDAENECKLAIDSVENIVAIGTIINVDIETKQQTVHGVPLGEENVRVTIIRTLVHEALLPFPIKDEIVTVKDAIGTCVAWPKNLVIAPAADAKKRSKRKNQKRTTRDMCEDNEDLQNLPPNLPVAVTALCIWANTDLRDGVTIYTTFDAEIFGHPKKAVVFRSDIYAMAHMLEIGGGCIVFYMSYLYNVLKSSKMTDMVAFVDPDHTGALGCGNPTERARSLSNRFENGKPGQIYLVPYNSGSHWMLSVVNPDEEMIYFMDPLKRRLITGEWKTILDNSIKIYNVHKNRKGRKLIQWKNLAGILEQNGGKSCGYWIMRYMKEIVEDTNLEFATKWERRTNLVYTKRILMKFGLNGQNML